MVYASREAEHEAVLTVARQICAAIRTAPKTRGLDYLESCILTGEDLERLADKMDENCPTPATSPPSAATQPISASARRWCWWG